MIRLLVADDQALVRGALASAHTLLTAGEWQGASLKAVDFLGIHDAYVTLLN